jgi:hypothetical protein
MWMLHCRILSRVYYCSFRSTVLLGNWREDSCTSVSKDGGSLWEASGCNRLRKLCVILFRSISSILPSWKHSSFWTRSRLLQSLLKCIPESQTRALNKEKTKKNVGIIGPATVGGINVSRSNMLCVQYCMNMRESHVDHHRFSFRTFSPGTFKSETLAAWSTMM